MEKNYEGFMDTLHAIQRKVCSEAEQDINVAEKAMKKVKDPVVIQNLQSEIDKREDIIHSIH